MLRLKEQSAALQMTGHRCRQCRPSSGEAPSFADPDNVDIDIDNGLLKMKTLPLKMVCSCDQLSSVQTTWYMNQAVRSWLHAVLRTLLLAVHGRRGSSSRASLRKLAVWAETHREEQQQRLRDVEHQMDKLATDRDELAQQQQAVIAAQAALDRQHVELKVQLVASVRREIVAHGLLCLLWYMSDG